MNSASEFLKSIIFFLIGKFLKSITNGLIARLHCTGDVETRSSGQSTGSNAPIIHQAEANGNEHLLPPTGNFNSGLGPGALNVGSGAGGLNGNIGNITIRLNRQGCEMEVPKGKNINIGLGPGAVNAGAGAGGLNNNQGDITIE